MNIESEEGYAAYCENWVPEEEEQGEQVVGTGKIEFKNLRVRYRNDLPDVLKGVDCVIQPGEKIGIVGRTGAGKTTIINTLLGLTEISSGSILIDDHPIRNFSLKALRQSVTMIDQEPTLIKSSFR
jgi:ABC-type multidrug transport system fused ATPase/permease subunit